MKERLEKNSLLNKDSGCIEWTGHLFNGYGVITTKRTDGKWKGARAHRIAYEEYVGEIPEGLFVCHHCDNRKCINPNHLFVGTNMDNVRDRDAKGRGNQQKGELHGRAKLTEKDVIEAKELRKEGYSYGWLADKFGVKYNAMICAVKGKTWRGLRTEEELIKPSQNNKIKICMNCHKEYVSNHGKQVYCKVECQPTRREYKLQRTIKLNRHITATRDRE